jgi:hypothetical protein
VMFTTNNLPCPTDIWLAPPIFALPHRYLTCPIYYPPHVDV